VNDQCSGTTIITLIHIKAIDRLAMASAAVETKTTAHALERRNAIFAR
jgi:hypothetical protein